MVRRAAFGRIIVALLALLLHGAALAQAFPTRPLKVIVPFPAGGTQDQLARTVAEALAHGLKQPVVVDNRPGAAGNIGAEALARATPDGYTLGLLSGVHTANTGFYRRIGFDLERDFAPVRLLGESAILIVASPTVPFHDMAGLLAHAKAQPGKLHFGSTTSLTMDLLRSMTGIEVTMVTYRGVGDAVQDVMAGRVELSAGPAPQLVPLVRDGRLRAIGLAGGRLPQLPQVRPVADTVPGYDAGMWYALFAPAGTPAAVLERLGGEVAQALRAPATLNRLQAMGVEPALGAAPNEALLRRMQAETARWRAVAARTGNYAN